MFGKAFLSMYEGSMVGVGPVKFAVWNYAIAKAHKSRVELNPRLVGLILGCSEDEVREALEWACAPDPESRNKDFGGARLVKEGQFQYFMPSWEYYHGIRSEDERRAYNRRKQAESRERKKGQSKVLKPVKDNQTGETVVDKNGTVEHPNGDPGEIAAAKVIKSTERLADTDDDGRTRRQMEQAHMNQPEPEDIKERWPPEGAR